MELSTNALFIQVMEGSIHETQHLDYSYTSFSGHLVEPRSDFDFRPPRRRKSDDNFIGRGADQQVLMLNVLGQRGLKMLSTQCFMEAMCNFIFNVRNM